MKTNVSDFSWAYKNVFIDYKIGALSEVFIAPIMKTTYLRFDYEGDLTPSDTFAYVDATSMFSILNFTLEPRVNLVNKSNFNLFLKSPITVGLSVSRERDAGNLANKAGVFNFNIPLILGYAKGLNSSFTNSNKNGFAISAGYQFLIAPLVGGKSIILENTYNKPLYEPYQKRKLWGMPIVQFDYYYLNKNKKIKGYSFSFCPYGNFYIKLAYKFAGSEK